MPILKRRKSYSAVIGGVRVGCEVPVVVQSMTNTDTADIPGTIDQVAALARAGSELVRVTVNNETPRRAVPHIVEGLERVGVRVPDHRRLSLQRPPAAEEVSRLRARRWPSTASIPAMFRSARKTTTTSAS